MRIAVWSYTAATVIACFAVAALGGLFGNIYHYHLGGKPLPPVTDLLVEHSWWALAIPLPWLFAAIRLSLRDAATYDRIFVFTGLSTLMIVSLLAFTAIALALPFLSIIVSMR